VKGRKRHIVVDTIGLLLAVVVHTADIQDRDGAKLVLSKLLGRFPRLHLIWADGAYAGQLVGWASALGGWLIAVVKRARPTHSFEVLPRRWVVERTFGWLGRNRRLSKDYEELTESSEAWVQIAMIHLMLKRLRPTWIDFEHRL
jgi:putative transposase